MRSGLAPHPWATRDENPAAVVKRVRSLPLSAEIRQAWQYSNDHYIILGHIVSVLTGQPLHEFIGRHVLQPLGMHDSLYNHTEARSTGRFTDSFFHLNRSTGGIGKAEAVEQYFPGTRLNLAAAGGLVSSSRDVATWLQELLDPQHLSTPLLHNISMGRAIATGVSPEPEIGVRLYGMAQALSSYRGVQMTYHTGLIVDQYSIIVRLPHHDIGIAVLTNDDIGSHLLSPIVRRVIEDMLKMDFVDWEKREIEPALNQEVHAQTPPTVQLPPTAENITGPYFHPGYGTLLVRPIDKQDRVLLSALPPELAVDNRTVIAEFPHLDFPPKFIFTHRDKDVYDVTMVAMRELKKGGTIALQPVEVARAEINGIKGKIAFDAKFWIAEPAVAGNQTLVFTVDPPQA